MEQIIVQMGNESLKQGITNINGLPCITTLKHLALSLRSTESPTETLLKMLPNLKRQYERPGPQRLPLVMHGVHDNSETRPKQASRLLRLPDELTSMIVDYLDPADTVCLAQSCASMRRLVDCTLPDVQRFAIAWVFDRRASGLAMLSCVFEATRRLDRGCVLMLERSGSVSTGQALVCGVCVKLHPVECFTQAERERADGCKRRCVASQRRLRICDRWSEDLVGLRRARESLMTSHGRHGEIKAPGEGCGSHAPTPLRPVTPALPLRAHSISHCRGDCSITLNCRDQLVVHRKIPILTDWARWYPDEADGRLHRALKLAMQIHGSAGVMVCEHTRLGDDAVVDAIDPRVASGRALEMSRTRSCARCRTMWNFVTARRPEMYGAMDVSLKVRRVVEDLGDPWDERYLALTVGV